MSTLRVDLGRGITAEHVLERQAAERRPQPVAAGRVGPRATHESRGTAQENFRLPP
jgi:hypothetical protein